MLCLLLSRVRAQKSNLAPVAIVVMALSAGTLAQDPSSLPHPEEPLSLEADSAASTRSPSDSPADSTDSPFDLLQADRLTGDWGGLRTGLEDLGVTFDPSVVFVYERNVRGGANTHNGREAAGMFLYDVEVDFEKLNLVPGATFFLRAVQTWSNGIQSDVGSNSQPHLYVGDWGNYFYGDEKCILIDKWWYRQFFLDNRIELRLGKLVTVADLFDNSDYASNPLDSFMNGYLVVNPTILAGYGLGAFLKVWPTDWLYFQMTGADIANPVDRTGFDTAFHGDARFVGTWELGLLPAWIDGNKHAVTSRYKVGCWYNPTVREVFRNDYGGRLPARSRGDDVGYYICIDQQLWKENVDPLDEQGLGVCLRYGFAHGDINRIRHFWSVAAVWEGLIPERDTDALGVGVAQGILSSQYRHEIDSRADRETVYELYYRYQITPWFALTPDMQVITNPGASKDGRDAVILGLRAKVTF